MRLLWLLMALATFSSSAPGAAPWALRAKTAAQRVALQAREREILYSGRKWGGKSWLDWVKVIDYCGTYAGSRGLVCREERASMDNTTLPVLWEVVPPDWRRCWREQKSMLVLPNGSEIHVDGLDKPRRIQGSRYGIAACDQAEDLDLEQFTILNGSVGQAETLFGERLPYRQLLLTVNPSHTGHWAYARYQPDLGDGVRREDAFGRPLDARVIHVQPEDLMDTIAPDYRATLEGMHGVFRNRLWLGLWCSAEGQVFDNWDPALHVVEMPALWRTWGGYPPPDWPRYFGIDFGYAPDPFAAGWWAESPEGVRYLYRQLCHLRRTIEQQAEQILALEVEELAALRAACPQERAQELAPYLDALNVAARFSDHHRGERAMLAERGIYTAPADKDVLASVQTLLALLKPQVLVGDRLMPRAVIVRNSLAEIDRELRSQGRPCSLEEEAPGYQWRAQRESALGGISRQLPRQINDHCIDGMLRYVHHSLASRLEFKVWA